jgi:hypothetical protein
MTGMSDSMVSSNVLVEIGDLFAMGGILSNCGTYPLRMCSVFYNRRCWYSAAFRPHSSFSGRFLQPVTAEPPLVVNARGGGPSS